MTEQSLPLKQLKDVLADGPRHIVDLVDDILEVFRAQAMRLEWEDGKCRVQSLPLGSSPPMDVEIPLSVFRAILVRLATLCNQHSPESVSPYGGDGEFLWDSQQFRIEFSNNNPEGFHFEIFPVSHASKPTGAKAGNLTGPDPL